MAGSGGMGEVYRLRDTPLGREVAAAILPEVFARDAERLRRFQQEVQVLSALNSPNILAVYDVGRTIRRIEADVRPAAIPRHVCQLLLQPTSYRRMAAGGFRAAARGRESRRV